MLVGAMVASLAACGGSSSGGAAPAEAEKTENSEERANKMRKAVLDNCKKMRENLNDVQYSKYLSVINATMNNKGLQSVVK